MLAVTSAQGLHVTKIDKPREVFFFFCCCVSFVLLKEGKMKQHDRNNEDKIEEGLII